MRVQLTGSGGRECLAHVVVGRLGCPESHGLGDRPGGNARHLWHPGHARPPRGQVDLADVHPTDRGATLDRFDQSQQDGQQGRLAAAGRAGDRHHLAALDPQARHAHQAVVARDGHVAYLDDRVRRRHGGPQVERPLQQVERLLRSGHAVGAVVVVQAEAADGQERLRGEQEDEHPGGEVEVTADDPQSRRDRDQRHRERREQLQHESGEEGCAQRADGRLPVPLPHHAQAAVRAASEGAQRQHAGGEVGEVAAQPGQLVPPAVEVVAGRHPHQHQEADDEGHRQADDDRGQQVHRQQRHDHHARHQHGEHELGQEPADVTVQPVEARTQQGRDPGGRRSVTGTSRVQQRIDDVVPQLGAHAHGRPCGGRRGQVPEESATHEAPHEGDDRRRRQRRVGEPPGHQVREQSGLRHDRECRQPTEEDGRDEVSPDGAGATDEARVEGCHDAVTPGCGGCRCGAGRPSTTTPGSRSRSA